MKADFINIFKELKETLFKELTGKHDGADPTIRESQKRNRNYIYIKANANSRVENYKN